MSIESDRLIEAFSDAVGTQQAEQMVTDAASATGTGASETYSEEEAKTIADHIADRDDVSTFVSISASTLKTRITTSEI